MALSELQKKQRKIGGSSAGIAMGLSKYVRPESLRRSLSYSLLGSDAIQEWIQPYLKQEDNILTEKELIQREIDKIEKGIDNIHTRVGTFLEPWVRERLKSMGVKIRVANEMLVHPDFDYITANIDGRQGSTVEEIKCISIYRKSEFGSEFSDEIPGDYGAQIGHYQLFPQFNNSRLRVLFLTESEKELVDRMIRGMILGHIKKNNITITDDPVEIIVPRFGAVMMAKKKLEEYRNGGICSMNLDVIKNIVDIAPLQTYELTITEKMRENMLSTYADLWHRARNNIPCVPVSLEDCQILYDGYSSGIKKTATDKEKRLRIERDILVREIKEKQTRLDAIAAECMIEAGPADIVMGPDKKALYRIGQKWSPTKNEGPLRDWVDKRSKELSEQSGTDIPAEDVLCGYLKQDVIDWDKVKAEIPEVYHRCRIKCARGVQWPRV